jgi:hypothetical protein
VTRASVSNHNTEDYWALQRSLPFPCSTMSCMRSWLKPDTKVFNNWVWGQISSQALYFREHKRGNQCIVMWQRYTSVQMIACKVD